MTTLSENLMSIPSVVIKSVTRIIYYLPSTGSSMGHFHITIFVVLDSGRQISTFTILDFIDFPDWISHIVMDEIFCLSLMSDYQLLSLNFY